MKKSVKFVFLKEHKNLTSELTPNRTYFLGSRLIYLCLNVVFTSLSLWSSATIQTIVGQSPSALNVLQI